VYKVCHESVSVCELLCDVSCHFPDLISIPVCTRITADIGSCLQTFTFARKFQDQAENYSKFFSVLFRLIETELLQKEKSSLIEDFMATFRAKTKKSRYHPTNISNPASAPDSGNDTYDPGKKIDEILGSFINSCHTHNMVPVLVGGKRSEENETNIPDPRYTIEAIINQVTKNPLKGLKIFFQCEDTMEQEHQSWVSMMWSAEWT
jgi:hypothetical protein